MELPHGRQVQTIMRLRSAFKPVVDGCSPSGDFVGPGSLDPNKKSEIIVGTSTFASLTRFGSSMPRIGSWRRAA